jgi:hypothetical protein
MASVRKVSIVRQGYSSKRRFGETGLDVNGCVSQDRIEEDKEVIAALELRKGPRISPVRR